VREFDKYMIEYETSTNKEHHSNLNRFLDTQRYNNAKYIHYKKKPVFSNTGFFSIDLI